MSFDLFVLIGNTTKVDQQRWVEALDEVGLECKFPSDFVIGDVYNELTVSCKLKPPLIEQETVFSDYNLELSPGTLDIQLIDDLKNESSDEQLVQILSEVKKEIFLYSSAGRDDYALIVQCYLAATLAKSCNGILFDPQECGVVHGDAVYEVAKSHSQSEKTKPRARAEPIQTKLQHKPKPKSTLKTVLVWVVIFIAILFIGDLLDYLYRLYR